eukprot:3688725-Pyramimonas_sp.AAC.1
MAATDKKFLERLNFSSKGGPRKLQEAPGGLRRSPSDPQEAPGGFRREAPGDSRRLQEALGS